MKINNSNLRILYLLAFFKNALFWYGIWVFYYLLFTDYAGIGLIESVMIFVFIIFEIPSGAISDLLGKKKTLIMSFLFLAIGNVVMATAIGYGYLLLAVFLLSIAAALYSGTSEALTYDSLKERGKEADYDKVISNVTTIEMLAVSIASIIGGFLFVVSADLPFWVTGCMGLFGLIVALFIVEPNINTEKFSWSNFINQNKQGLKQLSKTPSIKRRTVLLLSISFFTVVVYEVLNDVLAVEFGFNPSQLGILLGVLALIAAIASQMTSRLNNHFKLDNVFFFVGTGIVITLVVSPFAGLVLGGVTIIFRVVFQIIFRNLTSIALNKNTDSKYRATTLSTFNFLKNIPYIIIAYYIGYMMDLFTAKMFAAGMGMLMFLVLIVQYLLNRFTRKEEVVEKDNSSLV